jgi:hypothetical protein
MRSQVSLMLSFSPEPGPPWNNDYQIRSKIDKKSVKIDQKTKKLVKSRLKIGLSGHFS